MKGPDRPRPAAPVMQRGAVDPDLVRKLYEQIGTLYEVIQSAEPRTIKMASDDETRGVQEFTDFLATVHRMLRNPQGPTAQALRLALHRYEHSRTGGAA